MNQSCDAAEQIVRMSLDGVEVAARITGAAAKEIAVLLLAALKNKNSTLKPRGKERLISMLKSGKPLEIFSVKERDLQTFMQGAKQYGVVYTVLRNTKNNQDGLCDILVKADDAPKISRLVERFKFATVDKASIKSEIVAERAERAESKKQAASKPEKTESNKTAADTQPGVPDSGDIEKLLDDLLGTKDGKVEPDKPAPEKTEPVIASSEKTEPAKSTPEVTGKEQPSDRPFTQDSSPTPLPSELSSDSRKKPERIISTKPSVKEEMREIAAARKLKETEAPKRDERQSADKVKNTPATTIHKQPQRGKSTNMKGNR